jgi:hypothetical protein
MQILAQSALFPIRPRPWDVYDYGASLPRMTLVCALRGTDGFVLAADTKASERHEPCSIEQVLGTVMSTSHTSKIITSSRHDVAVGFAETDEARKAAEVLIEHLDSLPRVPDNPKEELEKACQAACNFYPQLMPPARRKPLGGSLILVNPGSKDRPILRVIFTLYGDGQFTCDPLGAADKHLIGYDVNSAIFFLENCYSFIGNPQSVNQLVLLAGHTILAASRLSPGRIEGLEIAVCREGELPQFVQGSTIKAIHETSRSILEGIQRLLEPFPNISLSPSRDSSPTRI